jgi:hypothetical protein
MINFFYKEEPSTAQHETEIAVGYIGTQKLYRITKKEDGRFLAEKKKKNGQWISIANCATSAECEQQCVKYATEKAVAPDRKKTELQATKYDKHGRALFNVSARQNWLA